MKQARAFAIAVVIVVAVYAAWHQLGKFGTAEQKVELLDPARVELIRTPGGFLQVSEMRKVEEFGWKTAWECPVVDCKSLPATVSRVRVGAHYVYRIPLAAHWRLQSAGDHYELVVPPLQVQLPVAFDTSRMEIVTTEKSIFSPAVPPNRENAMRHLGPELGRRGGSLPYIETQQRNAEQTVQEFARKWMLEQGKKPDKPIKVVFSGPNPL